MAPDIAIGYFTAVKIKQTLQRYWTLEFFHLHIGTLDIGYFMRI